jgi:hypothetical protein
VSAYLAIDGDPGRMGKGGDHLIVGSLLKTHFVSRDTKCIAHVRAHVVVVIARDEPKM